MVLEDLRVLEPRLVRPPRVGPDVDRNLHSLVGRLEAACKVGGRVAKVGATAEPSHAVEHLKSAAFGDPQPRVISGYLGVSRSISSPPPLAIRSRARGLLSAICSSAASACSLATSLPKVPSCTSGTSAFAALSAVWHGTLSARMAAHAADCTCSCSCGDDSSLTTCWTAPASQTYRAWSLSRSVVGSSVAMASSAASAFRCAAAVASAVGESSATSSSTIPALMAALR
mmetsp:Transcript_40367/g.130589  ORF Transcript_40367/g.130589 Transcript_40367/m.130589 type:complete len:229 (+) Transcript_40367:409-1095(+)